MYNGLSYFRNQAIIEAMIYFSYNLVKHTHIHT